MNTKKNFLIATLSAILLLAISLLGKPTLPAPAVTFWATAQAQEPAFRQENHDARGHRPCSLRTMKGTHGYSYSGTVMSKAITAAGPISFDGYGALHATYNVNLGGVPFTGQFTGTYTVNDDCTGTVTLFLPLLGLSTNGSFIITQNGQETYFTGTDTGVAITGATKKL